LKGQLANQNLANIAAQDSRLAAAVNGSGTSNPNFSVGSGTIAEAMLKRSFPFLPTTRGLSLAGVGFRILIQVRYGDLFHQIFHFVGCGSRLRCRRTPLDKLSEVSAYIDATNQMLVDQAAAQGKSLIPTIANAAALNLLNTDAFLLIRFYPKQFFEEKRIRRDRHRV